jgi:nitrogenase molybdenum-iron protein NifN
MSLIFEIANLMIEQIEHHHPNDWPLTPEALRAANATVETPGNKRLVTTDANSTLADASA